jgi:RNA polymerase sigma-70 factor (ECF subfamily)
MKPTTVTDSLPVPANGIALRQRELGIPTLVGMADFPLTFRDRLDSLPDVVETEINWPEALRATENSDAVTALRRILLNGLRIALNGRTDVNEAQLEDFTQEALLRILERLDQFAGRSKFTTWAHTIAVNTAFTELRRKRWKDVSLEALAADGEQLSELATLSDDAFGGDEERSRLVEILRKAVAEKLSAKQRTAIVCTLQELPIDQIVELLGTNRNSAYKLLHDARRALKQYLAAEGITQEDIRTAFGL